MNSVSVATAAFSEFELKEAIRNNNIKIMRYTSIEIKFLLQYQQANRNRKEK